MAERDAIQTVHASCVSLDGKSVLISGASGSGKSALALQLMALGATLVSDDRTHVQASHDGLVASAPKSIQGLIEARGVGILCAQHTEPCPVDFVVDLDCSETSRLPLLHERQICGVNLPCLHKIEGPHFPAAVLQYLKAGRRDPK